MTARDALAILSLPRAADEDADQHELDRYSAIETLATALGLTEEAAAAHAVVRALVTKDAQQMRLFHLLDKDRDTEGNGHT